MTEVIVLVLAIFQIMGVISAAHAIMATRTPQGAIAWGISLITVPYIAVPLYWVLGRSKFDGYVKVWQRLSVEYEDELDTIRQKITPYVVVNSINYPEYEAAMQLAESPMLSGNDVDLLIDGESTFNSIYEGIEQARNYVLFQFYIFRDDKTGNRFKQKLIEKASQGLTVFVLYDELGSSELTQQWLSDFSRHGIQISPFNTRQGKRNHFQVNFRNHRKIVVVDGCSAWLGGLNIGDDYLGADKKLTPWRDTHIKITGPAALMAQSTFCSDWYYATKALIKGMNWLPAGPTAEANDSQEEVMILSSGPSDKLETASLFFTNAINVARKRIWIATPYFIPDESTFATLHLALLRGLEVRIITPKLNDNWFVQHAANIYLSDLAQQGAKIYFYDNGFMHQKVMLIDDKFSMIGTVNFDNRSFRLNFEVTGAVASESFASEVESMLIHDMNNSIEGVGYKLSEQSFWERFKSRASDLLAPVL